jgi:DNA polymerase III sliding clamp (beta) subunit (PCNA family)
MKMVISAFHLYWASKFAFRPGKKDPPKNIQNILVHGHGNLCRICATDGHRMVLFEDDSASPDRFTAIIKPDPLLIKACSSGYYVEIEDTGIVTVLDSDQSITYRTFTSVLEETTFPFYPQVLPDSYSVDENKTSLISFNVSYLKDFEFGERGVQLVVIGDASQPLVVLHEAYPEMIGILMPMRSALTEDKYPLLSKLKEVDVTEFTTIKTDTLKRDE